MLDEPVHESPQLLNHYTATALLLTLLAALACLIQIYRGQLQGAAGASGTLQWLWLQEVPAAAGSWVPKVRLLLYEWLHAGSFRPGGGTGPLLLLLLVVLLLRLQLQLLLLLLLALPAGKCLRVAQLLWLQLAHMFHTSSQSCTDLHWIELFLGAAQSYELAQIMAVHDVGCQQSGLVSESAGKTPIDSTRCITGTVAAVCSCVAATAAVAATALSGCAVAAAVLRGLAAGMAAATSGGVEGHTLHSKCAVS
jgi:hypothetical protein